MVEELPPFIDEEIEYAEGGAESESEVHKHRFFLNINRTSDGKWACGYVHYASDEEGEMAIPRLVINDGDSLEEVGVRMRHKLDNWYKLNG